MSAESFFSIYCSSLPSIQQGGLSYEEMQARGAVVKEKHESDGEDESGREISEREARLGPILLSDGELNPNWTTADYAAESRMLYERSPPGPDDSDFMSEQTNDEDESDGKKEKKAEHQSENEEGKEEEDNYLDFGNWGQSQDLYNPYQFDN